MNASPSTEADGLRRKIRTLIGIFIVALVLSGITAFPLLHELNFLVRLLGADAPGHPEGGLHWWIRTVRDGLADTDARHPWMAYGTDWLAFAHLAIAVFFIGPWRDPVRNIWILHAGLIACIGVVVLALVCGPIRGIPLYWRLIDCSFGIATFPILWWAVKLTRRLASEKLPMSAPPPPLTSIG